MTSYRSITTEITVSNTDQHPVFGEGNTQVRLADEAGGPFIELRQEDAGPLRFDLEELALIYEKARAMVKAAERLQEGTA
jgi:hypothetical protein